MWIKVKDRLPQQAGAYRVKRRGGPQPARPAWEDECQYTPPVELTPGMIVCAPLWQNARGVRITSVVEWWEDDDGGA